MALVDKLWLMMCTCWWTTIGNTNHNHGYSHDGANTWMCSPWLFWMLILDSVHHRPSWIRGRFRAHSLELVQDRTEETCLKFAGQTLWKLYYRIYVRNGTKFKLSAVKVKGMSNCHPRWMWRAEGYGWYRLIYLCPYKTHWLITSVHTASRTGWKGTAKSHQQHIPSHPRSHLGCPNCLPGAVPPRGSRSFWSKRSSYMDHSQWLVLISIDFLDLPLSWLRLVGESSID